MLRDVEVRQLRALQAVSEEGSFGRAAERLGFTQSAISQQIAGLERAVGDKVFDRPGGPKRVELGRVLLGPPCQRGDLVLPRGGTEPAVRGVQGGHDRTISGLSVSFLNRG